MLVLFVASWGLLEKNSRLFFALLGVIRAMQDLATTDNVRFLVENAGSMADLHYQAFCTLLGIPSEPRSDYLWDPADHGYGVTRKRNFFRAHTDRQPIQERRQLCPKQGGPLIAKDGRPITLPPLLRTRDLLPFEVCWSSWTLYQPSALIWGRLRHFLQKSYPCPWQSAAGTLGRNNTTALPDPMETIPLSPPRSRGGLQ